MEPAPRAVTGVPHAFGGIPLNVGASLFPLIWGVVHGVVLGVWVQLGVGALWVIGGVLLRNPETGIAVLGLVFRGAAILGDVYFGVVADRLAWEKNPSRWETADYSKNQRIWAVGAVAYALALTWYQAGR
ncbi:hypothetical protein MX659_06465 [Coriobacteriia bacterium Es71-Z0120]|uniref:hypothetical protein n=1 Tax=Parvivirga hydrogeniphila TaxID=2939460 RepID=UPI002260C51C|nr:hypothetical protein [Parvivirga hydrogeniphila]MCL4079229.1 hypothetical protein [Parvivirga hydrogeniphila]